MKHQKQNRHPVFKSRLWVCLLWLVAALAACDSAEHIPVQKVNETDLVEDSENLALQLDRAAEERARSLKENDIYFGFDLRSSPEEDAAQYLPFLAYLSKTTGYNFKLHFTPKNSSSSEELGNKKVQLAAMGAVSYLIAREKYGAVALVQGLNVLNRAEYQSYFIVHPESPLKVIDDIKGRKLAFGSVDSTQGHLIPRIVMEKRGIALDDLSHYAYTGSHQNCAEAVVSGTFDVCALQDEMARDLTKKGLVRVLLTSDYYPSSAIVASRELDQEKLLKIRQALLAFDPKGVHKEILYNWEKTEMPNGFLVAAESDYEDLANWLLQLQLLN